MKNRFLCLLVCLALLISPAAGTLVLRTDAADISQPVSGAERFEQLQSIAEIIKAVGIYSSDDADPISEALIAAMDSDPDLYYRIADAVLKNHDSHSGYFSAEQYDASYAPQQSYAGIGITMQAGNSGFTVTEVVSGGPASAAGIMVGDIITAVNGIDVSSMSTQSLSDAVRGEAGTTVTVTVLRGGVRMSFTAVRDYISVPNFSSQELEPGITYMNLSRFGTLQDYVDFCSAWDKLYLTGTKAVILDLRGNPGGNLTIATQLLKKIVPDKDLALCAYLTRDAAGGFEVEYSTGAGVPLNRIIVLVDENSASAAEVMAGSLHDLGFASVVGTTTYGKGTGQYHLSFADGDTVVISMMKIMLPSGDIYDGKGIKPDYFVENSVINYPVPDDLLPLSLTRELYMTNWSDMTKALNQRLSLLGFLNKPDYRMRCFDSDTLTALNSYQTAHGLPRTKYADKRTLAAINRDFEALAASQVTWDFQLDKAVELAREVLDDDPVYTVDDLGVPSAVPGYISPAAYVGAF